MSKIAMQKVVRQALKGVAEAQRDYKLWTGGSWLSEAPEYLIPCRIAQAICRIKGAFYLTLEYNVSSAIEDAGGMGRGRPKKHLRPQGRYDMLLWWANATPRTVIEVKNQVERFSAIEADVEKICAVLELKKKTTIRNALIAFFTSNMDKKGDGTQATVVMKRRLEDIERDVKTFVCRRNVTVKLHKKSIRVDRESTWVPVVLEIKRTGGQS